jgi:hypothetical protein
MGLVANKIDKVDKLIILEFNDICFTAIISIVVTYRLFGAQSLDLL